MRTWRTLAALAVLLVLAGCSSGPTATIVPTATVTPIPTATQTPQAKTVYVAAGLNVYALNAATGAVLWTYKTSPGAVAGRGIGDLTLAGNALLFLNDNDSSLYALSPSTGTLLWKVGSVQGPQGGGNLVTGNDMVIAYGSIGQFLSSISAVNLTTGQVLWRQNRGADAVVISQGMIYVAAPQPGSDAQPNSQGYIRALNPATGAAVWQTTGHPFDSVVLIGGAVYAATMGSDIIYGFSAQTGAQQWSHAFPVPGTVIPTPSIQGSGSSLYIAGGEFYAVDGTSHQVLWQSPSVPPYAGNAMQTGGAICIGSGRYIDGLDSSSGKQVWQADALPSGGNAQMILAGDGQCLAGNNADENTAPVVAVDAETGAVRWTLNVGGRYARAAAQAGTLYMVSGGSFSGGTTTVATVRALDEATGAVRWQFNTGSNLAGYITLE